MAYNRSVFPEGGADTFIELVDLPPDRVVDAERYQVLKKKSNKTLQEIEELNNLSVALSNYILTPEKYNKLGDAITGTQQFFNNNVQGYIELKQEEFNAELSKFTYRGIYNPSTQYYAKNYVTFNDGTGDNIFICVNNALNIEPTNTTRWRKLGIKGDRGQAGQDGIGLVPKGMWNDSTIYNLNDGVFYNGALFASATNDNIGNTPIIGQDANGWNQVLNVTVATTTLKGQRNLLSNSNTVNFFTGKINAYNPNTDDLVVIKNTVNLEEGIDYIVNSDNQSITKTSGVWNAGTIFYFRVTRNQINNLVFSDGQSIQDGTITKNKLSADVISALISIGDTPPTDSLFWLDTSN